jgi:hypothetical protein
MDGSGVVGSLMQSSEAVDFGGVGVNDPTVGWVGVLVGGDPAAGDPAVEGDVGHAEVAGEF